MIHNEDGCDADVQGLANGVERFLHSLFISKNSSSSFSTYPSQSFFGSLIPH